MGYKEEIIEMLESISNERILKLIYGFVRRGYGEDMAEKGGLYLWAFRGYGQTDFKRVSREDLSES